jgi:hypothetical protein
MTKAAPTFKILRRRVQQRMRAQRRRPLQALLARTRFGIRLRRAARIQPGRDPYRPTLR